MLIQSSLRCGTARGARRHAEGLGDLASARLACSRGRAPVPATPSCSVAEKAPQPARNRAVFIKGRSSEGVILPSILEAVMGAQEKGQVNGVLAFGQLPFFWCLLSELMKTTRFLAGPPSKMRASYWLSLSSCGVHGGSFDLRRRPWSWRRTLCSYILRCAAELRAGHAAATPRGPRLGARVRASAAA